jgi:hypothetical protein
MTRTDNQAGARNDRKISSLLPPATHPQIRSVAEAGLEQLLHSLENADVSQDVVLQVVLNLLSKLDAAHCRLVAQQLQQLTDDF